MVSFVFVSSILCVAAASFIPPYYGGSASYDDFRRHCRNDRRNDADGLLGSKYGGYGALDGGYENGYQGTGYGHNQGNQGRYGKDYGVSGYNAGNTGYDRGEAKGYGNAHHDGGATAAEDAEGFKKYSYFTSGSGPEGTYSKGSYGSNGYEHEDSNSKYAADVNGGGYKKGYETDSKHNADEYSDYDKDSSSHSGFGKKYDVEKFAHSGAIFDKEGHSDGFTGNNHKEAKHGKSY